MRCVTGVTRVVVGNENVAFDFYSPLMSLPHVVGTTLETIPANVPYVHPDATVAQAWAGRLASCGQSLKVGLVWAGSPTHANDKNRSMTLAQFAPLSRVRGVTFTACRRAMPQRPPPIHRPQCSLSISPPTWPISPTPPR